MGGQPYARAIASLEPAKACADCRRLKLKCTRIWPCASCTRRKMAAFCPEGQSSGQTAVEALSAKIAFLEAQLKDRNSTADAYTPLVTALSTKYDISHSPSQFLKHRLDSPETATTLIGSKDATVSGPSSIDFDNSIFEQPGNAGLLVVINDGESSTYVGGGATSAHRVEIETHRMESTDSKQEFVVYNRHSLPPISEAKRYCAIYFMHACVEFTILSEISFYEQIFSVIYGQSSLLVCSRQEWAILFLVLAIGSHFDPTTLLSDRKPHTMFAVARSLLDPREFEEQHTMTSVRALHLMGIFSANARARGLERNWSWLGIQMRIVQAMGLHRDGAMFGLNSATVEQRRRLFWECQTFDRLHSLSLGRPYAIADSQIDTLFPQAIDELEHSFQTVKFRVGQLRGKIADELFSTKASSYRNVLAFDRQLRDLERSLHPLLRFTGSTTHNSDIQYDEVTTLPDMHTMRRFYLSIMLQETTMCLHRSHFARAIIEQDTDPLHSAYSSSVVAVMDAARRMVSTTISSWNAFPIVSIRWAFLWIRTFSAGVCIGACTARFPDSVLTTASLGDLFSLKEAFTMANKELCLTERPLTKWVQALDTICLAAEGSTTPARDSGPSLELIRGATRLAKRRKLDVLPDVETQKGIDPLTTPKKINDASKLFPEPHQHTDLSARKASTIEHTALLEKAMIPDLEDCFAFFDQSWIDLFPQRA